MHVVFPTLRTYAIPFVALNEVDPLELLDSYLGRKTKMAELQSGEGRMMIDSVVSVQHINVTDRQTDRQAGAMASHCNQIVQLIVARSHADSEQ